MALSPKQIHELPLLPEALNPSAVVPISQGGDTYRVAFETITDLAEDVARDTGAAAAITAVGTVATNAGAAAAAPFATTATNAAATASGAAVVASDAANLAQVRAAVAAISADAAGLAAAQALAASPLYASVPAGLSATVHGEFFSVLGSGGTFATLYQNVLGTGAQKESYPSVNGLAALPVQTLTTAAGWALALVDALKNISGGLSEDHREWTVAGLTTRLEADRRVTTYPADGGGAIEYLTDGSISIGGLRLIATDVPGMRLVYLYEDGSWDSGLTTEGVWLGLGGDSSALEGRVSTLEARVDALSGDSASPIVRADDGTSIGGRNDAANVGLSSGTATGATYRWAVYVPRGGYGLRVVLPASHIPNTSAAGQATLPNAYTASIWIEQAGRLVRATWGGQNSARVKGRERVSDPIPVAVAPGWLYGRTEVSVDAIGQKWPVADSRNATLGEGVYAAGLGSTLTENLPPAGSGSIFAPAALLARGSAAPTVAIVGSSSFYGQGDVAEAPAWDRGYSARALAQAGIGYVRLSSPGDRLSYFLTGSDYRRSMLVLSGASHVILGLGSNDIIAGVNAATMLDRLTQALDICGGLGVGVLLPTYTPRNASTDGWTSLGNQTVSSTDAVRQSLNATIRAGLGHPAITGVLDVAAYFEAPSSPGKWRVDLGGPLTADGTHPTQLGHRLGGQHLSPIITSILGV